MVRTQDNNAGETVVIVKQQDGRNNNNDGITTKAPMFLNRATSLWRSYSFKSSTAFSTTTPWVSRLASGISRRGMITVGTITAGTATCLVGL